jgi:hypothetical protein
VGAKARRIKKAGNLAEEFCLEAFGISEGDIYEIKSSSWQHYQVVLRATQLLASLRKQFVVVRFKRKITKPQKKGRRKKQRYLETMESAYENFKHVHVVRGIDLVKIVSGQKRALLLANIDKYLDRAPYWTVPIRCLPAEEMAKTDDYVLFGDPKDPPEWLSEK